ncbi:5747_t:CDS:1, partial [Cetraspora pellucida]
KTKIGSPAVHRACNKEIAPQNCKKIAAIIRNFPPEEAIASIKLTLVQGNSALQWITVSPGSAIPSSSRKLFKQRRAYKNSKKQEAVRQEAVRQEAIRQEAVRQEAVRQEAVRQEAVRQEAVRNAPLNLIDGWPFCLLPPSDYFSD